MLRAVWYGVLPPELSDRVALSGDPGAVTSDLATFVLIVTRGVEQDATPTSDVRLAFVDLVGLGDAFLFMPLTGETLVGDEGDLLPCLSMLGVALSRARLSPFESLLGLA